MLQKALTSGRPVVLGRTSCGAEACLSVAAIQRHDLSHICGDIHGKSGMGGLSQTLFGIEGGRWAKHDKFASEVAFQNWTYPLQADVPATSRPVGDVINGVGAYWGPGALTPKVCPLATGS